MAQDDRSRLTFDRYAERLARDLVALHRLWLVPLALCAFWLAIENSYQNVTELRRADAILEQSRERQQTQSARIFAQENPGKDGVRPFRQFDEAREKAQLERYNTQLDRHREIVRRLKSDAVNLTIAGTVMPSRLTFAPTLWLAALLAWLILFNAVRGRAHRNLAAAVAADQPERAAFGIVEESSVWVSPLPAGVRLNCPPAGREAVARSDMLSGLGWTEDDEKRNRVVTGIAWAGLLLIALRMGWIASEVNGAFAVEQGVIGTTGRVLNSAGVALLGVGALYLLYRIVTPARGTDPLPLPGRRDAIRMGLAASTVGALVFGKGAIQDTMFGRHPGQVLGKPRFLSGEVKRRRKTRRNVRVYGAPPGSVLMLDRSKAGLRPVIRGAGSSGETRFFSAVARPRRPVVLDAGAFADLGRRWDEGGGSRAAISASTLEAAALTLLEQGRIKQACDVLLGLCGHLAPSVGGPKAERVERPELRPFNLLAGLTVRYGDAAAYRGRLNELVRLAAASAAAAAEAEESDEAMPPDSTAAGVKIADAGATVGTKEAGPEAAPATAGAKVAATGATVGTKEAGGEAIPAPPAADPRENPFTFLTNKWGNEKWRKAWLERTHWGHPLDAADRSFGDRLLGRNGGRMRLVRLPAVDRR